MPSNPGMAEQESEISQSRSTRSARCVLQGAFDPSIVRSAMPSPELEAANAITESIRFPTASPAQFARVTASRLTDSKHRTLRISLIACSAALLQVVP
jgi:hypothetical protein